MVARWAGIDPNTLLPPVALQVGAAISEPCTFPRGRRVEEPSFMVFRVDTVLADIPDMQP